MDSAVGMPPSTVVVSTYCFAYKKVLSLAPIILSIGSINTSTPRENARVAAVQIKRL